MGGIATERIGSLFSGLWNMVRVFKGLGESACLKVTSGDRPPPPHWLRELDAQDIFSPNLITPHRAGRWCASRFHNFHWSLGRSPVFTWILDVTGAPLEGFGAIGRDFEAHMGNRDAIYQIPEQPSRSLPKSAWAERRRSRTWGFYARKQREI